MLPFLAQAQSKNTTDQILGAVYGSFGTACTQDADADLAQHNRLGPFTGNRRYLVYYHDGSGAGVACEMLQGTSSVDASAAVGMTLFAGEKVIVKIPLGKTYISVVPFADNMYWEACPLY